MSEAIVCEGAPRDVGSDQGRVCAEPLRERYAAKPWLERVLLRLGRGGSQVGRDLARHFPHQAESVAGLAVAAKVPAAWLTDMIEQEFRDTSALSAAVGAPFTDGGSLVARTLTGECIVRRSRPEGVFRSVEVTRPWLTAALAGVNERGLAVAVVAWGAAAGNCAAPCALLVQDCLERFEALDAALDWCMARPGGGCATLLFADAQGEVAGVRIAGDARRVLRPADGFLQAGAVPARAGELAKTLRDEAAPLDAAILADRLSVEAPAVLLEPAERRLTLGRESFDL